jgi:surface antigen
VSASETYNDAETVAAAWSDRDAPYQEFAESLGIAAAPSYHSESMAATKASVSSVTPKIVTPRRPLQCVPYARMVSGIALRGDARTWWESAAGRFRRGQDPEPGAVLVLKGSSKTPRGHVGVVAKIVNEREILIDHANWLNNRKIHLATPVIDVSPENDWSAIRVWYTPGAQYGANVYPTDGFIYPDNPSVFVTVADANVRERPTTRSARIALLPRQSKVEILGKIPGSPWYRVAHSGSAVGFVHAKLVAPTP